MMYIHLICTICLMCWVSIVVGLPGMLYPRESETRDLRSLDGIWDFTRNTTVYPKSKRKNLYKINLIDVIPMPVPASYNDVTQDRYIRDYVGTVWYQRNFFVPSIWRSNNIRVWLRFGSVHYKASVWIGSKKVTEHQIGHLPFEVEVTEFLKFGESNTITVSCDNVLSSKTIPQGSVGSINIGNVTIKKQTYQFDFFNYAGIHRPVILYTTPRIYIDDIDIKTSLNKYGSAVIDFDIKINGIDKQELAPFCYVALLYPNKTIVEAIESCTGQMVIKNPKLWWPYLMDSKPGFMYTMEIKLVAEDGLIVDVYRQPVGIRSLEWTNTSLLINNRPVYMRGFGRHEDSDLRGKGLDLVLVTKDYNLIKWIGANAFRTSHYPYAEEIMDFADREGIMIIDECSSVKAEGFSDELLKNHKQAMMELIRRDKNRPSVIAWSIANEPQSEEIPSNKYFGSVADYVRQLDPSRPITVALFKDSAKDQVAQHLDIISFNRYNGWYKNSGRLDNIVNEVVNDATQWHEKFNKPVIMSEYGADTLSGLHVNPSVLWTEDFQTELLSQHFKAFDILRSKNFFIGEFIWNFADFHTKQEFRRVDGNKKGIFTRNRQPKTAALLMRQRYLALAKILDKARIPTDVRPYIVNEKTEL